jgi:[acyl-carrier-protein] S-malonyltransferase
VYEEASEAVGYDVRRLCSEGPPEELTRTDRAQVAGFVASVAAWRVLQAACSTDGPETAAASIRSWVVVGHSLGDYSGLVACGHLTFSDALDVVVRRGEAMRRCSLENPGAMTAVLGLADTLVQAACENVPGVWPANFNSPGQVVISGALSALEEAEAECTRRGAKKVVRLQVAGAFHSPLMAEAAKEVQRALRKVKPAASVDPCFYSSTELSFPRVDEIVPMLVRQVTAPVRFAQAISQLTGGSIDMSAAEDGGPEGAVSPPRREGTTAAPPQFAVEIGPGRVLSGLVRKTVKGIPVVDTESDSGLGRAIERCGGRAG